MSHLFIVKNVKRNVLHMWQQNFLKFSQCYVLQQKVTDNKNDIGLQLRKGPTSGSQQVSTEVREKIKENTKTFSYTAIIVAGVGVTAVMFWAIFKELFSSCSPNNIYSDALDRVIQNPAGKMEYRYLFVQLDHYPNTTIILEDNRAFDPQPSSTYMHSNINQTTLNGSNISLTAFDAKK